jgi:DNA (cytosine-5)-methyltransferase 1
VNAEPVAPTVIRTEHRQALKAIFEAEARNASLPQCVRGELRAIISHWLQDPERPPLILPIEYADRWRTILGSEAARDDEPYAANLDQQIKIEFESLPFRRPKLPSFTFIDLFAGIGGFRLALQGLGGACAFSSEWDERAKETYFDNFGEWPFGDIKNFTTSDGMSAVFPNAIPEHEILAAGFPCQAFSQAGKQLGFDDARGTVFFEILKIARQHRPAGLLLENVKRLKTHDQRKTLSVIVNSLCELRYKVYVKVLRAYDFGLPQNRERIFIVALNGDFDFSFPKKAEAQGYNNVGAILEPDVPPKFTISDRLYDGHKRRLLEHRARGNGFGYSVFRADADYTNTLSARYWKDGSEILIEQEGKNPRMLTPRECARLQGFPDTFRVHRSSRHSYQQFGNSVPVPVVTEVARELLKSLKEKQPARQLIPFEPVIY